MLFAELSDALYEAAPLLGVAAVVIWAVLNPNSGAARDYRAGEAAGRAWRERHPALGALLVVVVAAAAIGVLIYRSR